MPIVHFDDKKALGEAIGILVHEVRGTFFVRSDEKIVVDTKQLEALKDAGLVDANGNPRKGKKGATRKSKR